MHGGQDLLLPQWQCVQQVVSSDPFCQRSNAAHQTWTMMARPDHFEEHILNEVASLRTLPPMLLLLLLLLKLEQVHQSSS